MQNYESSNTWKGQEDNRIIKQLISNLSWKSAATKDKATITNSNSYSSWIANEDSWKDDDSLSLDYFKKDIFC